MPLGWGNQGRHAGTMGQIPQEKHQGQLPGAGILLLYTSGARQRWARVHWERINRTPGLRSMELCLPVCPLRELSQHEPQLHTARHILARRAALTSAVFVFSLNRLHCTEAPGPLCAWRTALSSGPSPGLRVNLGRRGSLNCSL